MNGQFITINSDAYEMTSVPYILSLSASVPVPILLYQGVGEGQGTGMVGNFVAKPFFKKSLADLQSLKKTCLADMFFIFLSNYVVYGG